MIAGESDHDDLLHLLLEICEDFFAHTSSTTRDELDTVLLARDVTGGLSWLIDMLALTRRCLLNVGREHGGPTTQNAGHLHARYGNQPLEDGTVDRPASDPQLGE
jgi:hypothetical protein